MKGAWKALTIFVALRNNLASVSAFLRDYPENFDEFRSFTPAEKRYYAKENEFRFYITNRIIYAFLYQCIDNYTAMKGIDPDLEDEDIEKFLTSIDGSEFMNTLRILRNGILHIPNRNHREIAANRKAIAHFSEVCNNFEGGSYLIMISLKNLLYAYTDRIFSREKEIFPNLKGVDSEEIIASLEAAGLEFPEPPPVA